MPLLDCNPGHSLVHSNHKFKKMTQEEFLKWLDKVDSNKDGNISEKKLHAALKQLGLKHGTWKAWRALRTVDRNHNKVIDGNDERKLLISYAAKHWGIIVN